jgi:Secretion system C-terminal sorting domain
MKKTLLALSISFAAALSAQSTHKPAATSNVVYFEDFEKMPLGNFFDVVPDGVIPDFPNPTNWVYRGLPISSANFQIIDTGADNNKALKIIGSNAAGYNVAQKELKLDTTTNGPVMFIEWDFLTPPKNPDGMSQSVNSANFTFRLYDSENRPFIGTYYTSQNGLTSPQRAQTSNTGDLLPVDLRNIGQTIKLPYGTWLKFRIKYHINGQGYAQEDPATLFYYGTKAAMDQFDADNVGNPSAVVAADNTNLRMHTMPGYGTSTGFDTPVRTVPTWFQFKYESGKTVANYGSIDNVRIWFENFAPISTKALPDAAQDVSVYPNPTSDIININPKVEVKNIQVFNNSGVLVAEASQSQSINIAQLANGVYFVKYSDGVKDYRQKIVKK